MTLLAIWVPCGVLAYGITFAYFTRAYPRLREKRDIVFNVAVSVWMALWGPVGLVLSFLLSGFVQYGLLYRPPK